MLLMLRIALDESLVVCALLFAPGPLMVLFHARVHNGRRLGKHALITPILGSQAVHYGRQPLEIERAGCEDSLDLQ